MAANPHPLNRHLIVVDNLKLLQQMDNESIDLVCIDPPFAKNRTFTGKLNPALTDEEQTAERVKLSEWGVTDRTLAGRIGVEWPDNGHDSAAFDDTFTWAEDIHERWLEIIGQKCPPLHQLIETTRSVHSESHAAYLTYMGIRILEIHRVLRPKGSIYLHCDPTANSYLRIALDAVFGRNNFRDEIVWRIGWVSGFKTQKKGWIRNHDTILYYLKSSAAAQQFNKEYLPYPEGYVRRDGKPPSGKGIPIEDTWNCSSGDVLDSIMIKSFSTEKTGYPTQKPVALAERIIRASTNPGDVVLDCFAGCAYVPVAAERNDRQWIACDFNPRAMTVLRRQFHKFNYSVDGDAGEGRLLSEVNITVRGPNELPERSDTDPGPVMDAAAAVLDQPRRFKQPASLIPRDRMLEELLRFSGWRAWCCGFANTRLTESGEYELVETTQNFHLDHITPKSEEGSDQVTNRAPLCPYHNTSKGGRLIALPELRRQVLEAGEQRAPEGMLVDLAAAYQHALDLYADWRSAGGDPRSTDQR